MQVTLIINLNQSKSQKVSVIRNIPNAGSWDNSVVVNSNTDSF